MSTSPVIKTQATPASAYRRYANRPVKGGFLHHTAGTTLYTPAPGASAHRVFMPDGTIWNQVPIEHASHSVLMTDLFRPDWLVRCPDAQVSDANYCSINYEVVYAPQAPHFQEPTPEQYESINYAIRLDYSRYGPFPWLGHGQVQSDKWPTEPAEFDYAQAQLGPYIPNHGRYLLPTPEDPTQMNPATDAQIKEQLEQLGVGINPDTAIMQFVYRAYRAGDAPYGNWRGPALPPPGASDGGEYASTTASGAPSVRHRFTAGIVEFDLLTGGIGWVELVAQHPDIG